MTGGPVVKRDTDAHRALARRAAEAAATVLDLFERETPGDPRPRCAIQAIDEWAEGRRDLNLAEVRELSLDAHAAARSATGDAARFAARAAGQAVATWHVPAHADAVPGYVAKARAAAARS
ncbi:MAG: hypothetical protein EON90_14310 [Brevundimonas sp.]|nr:MAG: hypothetical protein EON90_14310 [Brevundimonas sp.]